MSGVVSARGSRRLVAVVVSFLVTAVAVVAGAKFGGKTAADGLMLDLSLRVAASLAHDRPVPPVAVVSVDERSLDSSELEDIPRVLFAPIWADLLDAVFAGGARSVGFDFLFTYSANRLLPNYDQPFMAALSKYQSHVVLARSEGVMPATPFRFAAGAMTDPNALGLIELEPDSDGVYRWVAAGQATGNGAEVIPSMTAALLAQAGYPPMPDRVLVAPMRHLESLPTYALVDVLRCAKTDPELVAERFRDRIVLIGSTLPEEDRKTSAGRFLASPPPVAPPAGTGCSLVPQSASVRGSQTVPGVFIHAGAIAAVAAGRLTRMAAPLLIAGTAGGTAIVGCLLGFVTTPAIAGAGTLLWLIGLGEFGVALLLLGYWLPLAVPMIALVAALGLAYSVRFALESRRRRQLQSAFNLFLAPEIVKRLDETERLDLGGEERPATIMFADLTGFTRMSTMLQSAELLALTNDYLEIMVNEINLHHGYVDKFIGDAVMAIWNAPLDDPQHTVHAVEAALTIAQRIADKRASTPPDMPCFDAVKIGIETGKATVGNVGSTQRLNYTAVGEIVNVAARLEGVPGDYNCMIVIGEAAAEVVRNMFLLREIDTVELRGRQNPLRIFEPICRLSEADARRREAVERYEFALELYRDRQFREAHKLWTELATGFEAEILLPGPALAMAAHAAALLAHAPEPGWRPVTVRYSK